MDGASCLPWLPAPAREGDPRALPPAELLTGTLPMQEFIIHSPDFEAAKFWVGNMGKTATHAVVFAQLYVPGGQCHGLHPFLVQVGCAAGGGVSETRSSPRGWVLLAFLCRRMLLSLLQPRGIPEKGPCTPRTGCC